MHSPLIFCLLVLFSLCLQQTSSEIQKQESSQLEYIKSSIFGSLRLPTEAEQQRFSFHRKIGLPDRIKALVSQRLETRKHGNQTKRGTYSPDNIKVTFDPKYPIDEETENVFIWAAEVLSIMFDITVPVQIFVSWEPMGNSVIGSAGPTYLASIGGVYYPIALWNQIQGKRLSNGYDISATFNSQFDFYLGTDGNTPSSQIDLASVVLHEFCHGLGFTSAAVWTATGPKYSVDHYIFDEYLYLGKDGSGGLVYKSVSLGNAFTSNNVYYIDNLKTPTVQAKMYAPSTWESGSSLSHLDQKTYHNTDDTLMTPAIAKGEYIHFIGPIVNQAFTSMGWTTRNCSTYKIESDCFEYCCSFCGDKETCGDPGVGDSCSGEWSYPPNCTGGEGKSSLTKCEQQSSCGSCTSYLECSWCPEEETCVDAAVVSFDCSDWQWAQCSIPGWVVLLLLIVLGLLALGFLFCTIRNCCCSNSRREYDYMN